MSWLRAWWLAALLLLLPTLARAEDDEGARSLLSGVARVVGAEEVDDWFSDREAMLAVVQHLLPSVCRASPEARDGALAGLRKRQVELGDPRALFAQHGEVSSEVSAALTAQRRL